MIIGVFQYDEESNSYTGAIRTPVCELHDVRFESNELLNEVVGDYIIRAHTPLGPVWCGTAWPARYHDKHYHCVELDDPTFPRPLQAFLFSAEAEGCFELCWTRPKGMFNDLWKPR